MFQCYFLKELQLFYCELPLCFSIHSSCIVLCLGPFASGLQGVDTVFPDLMLK